ncbi:MAG: glycosyl transferase, partial [Eubacteriales bacterium]
TNKRLTSRKIAIVKSYMAHHQGMSLLAMDNCLNNNIMQQRFHADPAVRSARLLLQEKIPENIVFTKEDKEKVLPIKGVEVKENNLLRRYNKPNFTLPKTHILTNGDYSVMLTDRGTGYSKTKEVAITRWREDSTMDLYGMFCFLRHVETDTVWLGAYAPQGLLPEKYEVVFTADKAQFKRLDENIETTTEIVVASGDNVEIRRITLKNMGEKTATMELTSYFEVILAPQAQDIAHPVFSNLFVKTEYLPEINCIIASRRPRSDKEKTWLSASMVVFDDDKPADVQYETDRMKFIGRGRNISSPDAVRIKTLSNSVGPVIDPVMSLRSSVTIEPGKKATVSFVTAVGNQHQPLIDLTQKYATPELVEAAFHLAKVQSQLEAKHMDIPEGDMELYEKMISHILYISPLKKRYGDMAEKNTRGQSSLWTYGISGDLPIVLVVVNNTEDHKLSYEVIKAHEYWWLQGLQVDLVILA